MIKKIYFLISFLIIAVIASVYTHALDWGVFDDYLGNSNKYALYKIINNIPIKYAILEEDIPAFVQNTSSKNTELNKLNTTLSGEQRQKGLQKIIEKSFNVWIGDTSDTRAEINKTGREQEFNDIKNLISKKIILQKVSDKKDADIVFVFIAKENITKKCSQKTAVACIQVRQEPKIVYLQNPYIEDRTSSDQRWKDILSDSIHEVGHYLALGDQYEDFNDTSLVYSTSDRIGKNNSIMAAQNTTNLQCDDIDGLINIIDITLAINNDGRFSNRATKGWASFCNGKSGFKDTFYRKAKVQNKAPVIRNGNAYNFNAEGSFTKKTKLFPFDFTDKEISYGEGFERDLVYNVEDKKNNISYAFYYERENGKKQVKVYAFFNNDFANPQPIIFERSSFSWDLIGYGKDKKSVNFTNNQCIITESNDKETTEYIFNENGKSFSKYVDTVSGEVNKKGLFYDKKIYPFKITITETLKHPVCTISFLKNNKFADALQFTQTTFIKEGTPILVSEERSFTEDIARKINMSHDDFINMSKGMCRTDIKTLKQYSDTCSIFFNADAYKY
jgi:hypothetical protein